MKQTKTKKPLSSEDGSVLDMYFDELNRHEVLGREEERELLVQAKQGSRQAVDRLVTGNLRLVVAIARQYDGQGVSLADLINEGNIGLIQAVTNWQEGTLAPQADRLIRKHITKLIEQMQPTLTPPLRSMSVDAPLRRNDRLTMLDIMPDDEVPASDSGVEHALAVDEMVRRMDRLNEREKAVVAAVYGIGREQATLAEVAQELGIKRERARQIRNKALRAMRLRKQ
jgi:RNA polymerase primary sigma factor